jgi:hypothetical protein
MKQVSKNEDDPQSSQNNMTILEAEKLKEIIKNGNSLWEMVVDAYNLGRYNTPRCV